ncbi:MAG: hypothetical protein Q4F97_12675 [Bacteroidales bacterium]|nr:hypothetical protein [Bacteroidales bacterium]
MSYQEAEKQRKIDNKNLLKKSMKSEMKNHKFDWKELCVDFLLFFVASVLTPIVTTYVSFNSKYCGFIIESILIIVLFGIKQIIEKRR